MKAKLVIPFIFEIDTTTGIGVLFPVMPDEAKAFVIAEAATGILTDALADVNDGATWAKLSIEGGANAAMILDYEPEQADPEQGQDSAEPEGEAGP
jgi:hypothetical protein